ncbi:kinase-like domain-containing protein, partial [Endogone sp. FLAS-F59071]
MSLRYREYKLSATRRTPVNPLSLNHAHGDDDGLIPNYNIFRVRPFDENDPYMPRKSSSRYPVSAERADDWDVEFATDVSVQADLDGGHRKAGVRRNGRRITSSSIEDYKIGDLLGSGGFGKVFRAVGISGPCKGKEVAIKMIDKSKTRTPALRRRIVNEVEIQCQLSHPSILTLHDYFEDRDGVYMVMELCAGGELYRYLQRRRRPLSEAEARGVMEQLVHGLLYMHKNGILHRDLKLSNVLLTDRFEVKIADFGLATKLSEHGEQKTMCGTPNYISPEIVSRQPYGLASDVWSLGCMLVTFLTGKPPFEGQQLGNPADQLKSTLDRVVKADYRLPKTLSAEAKDLVQRLLQLVGLSVFRSECIWFIVMAYELDPNRRLSLTRILDHPFFDHRLPVVPLKSDFGQGEDDEHWEDERMLPRRSRSRSLNEVGSITSVGERGRLQERERDRERQREMEMEQQREHERERVRELQRERERQKERELEQEQQLQRETERERERERLLEENQEKGAAHVYKVYVSQLWTE